MDGNNAIVIDHVTKLYKLYENDRQRLKGLFIKSVPCKKKKAINNLTITIKKGESVALIGRNGAGKSTILKLITGVAFPTCGKIEVNGKVSALLELSAGFDSESTGRENIYLKCGLMGMSNSEIAEVEDKIVEFADLGEYMDQPIKMYSSGMRSRLGFAINSNINPDILIVDEALSVGDKVFKKKCRAKVDEIMSSGNVTFILVTHSLTTAQEFCNRGIVLSKGKKLFDGPIEEAVEFYETKY